MERLQMKLDWVICGGESGPHARPMHPDWVRSARDQCVAAGGVPHARGDGCSRIEAARAGFACSPRAWGWSDKPLHKNTAVMVRVGKKLAGRMLDGREWNEFPNV
jgi:protein gp37